MKYRLFYELVCKTPIQASTDFCTAFSKNVLIALEENEYFCILASDWSHLSHPLERLSLLLPFFLSVSIPLTSYFSCSSSLSNPGWSHFYQFSFRISVTFWQICIVTQRDQTSQQPNLQAPLSLLIIVGKTFKAIYNDLFFSINFFNPSVKTPLL